MSWHYEELWLPSIDRLWHASAATTAHTAHAAVHPYVNFHDCLAPKPRLLTPSTVSSKTVSVLQYRVQSLTNRLLASAGAVAVNGQVTAPMLRRLQSSLTETARQARTHWAQFNYPSMAAGVLLMAGVSLSLVSCHCHRVALADMKAFRVQHMVAMIHSCQSCTA